MLLAKVFRQKIEKIAQGALLPLTASMATPSPGEVTIGPTSSAGKFRLVECARVGSFM